MQGEELDLAARTEQPQVFSSAQGQAFKGVMHVAMRNLAIAQQRDKERYMLVRGGDWDRLKATFQLGDYMLLKQQTDGTLDA